MRGKSGNVFSLISHDQWFRYWVFRAVPYFFAWQRHGSIFPTEVSVPGINVIRKISSDLIIAEESCNHHKKADKHPQGETFRYSILWLWTHLSEPACDRLYAVTIWIFVVSPPRERPIFCFPFFYAPVACGCTLVLVLSRHSASSLIWIIFFRWSPSKRCWRTPYFTPTIRANVKQYANSHNFSAVPSICSRFPWHTKSHSPVGNYSCLHFRVDAANVLQF